MAKLTQSGEVKGERKFIGKAWKNTVNKPGSEYDGQEYINLTFDQDMGTLEINGTDKFLLWPNVKREGINPKTNKPYVDADYRVSTELK